MLSRFLAPTLLTVALLACSSELPLEAQRGHANARPAAQGTTTLSWFEESAPLADGGGFVGSWSITEITQGPDGTLLASGTVEGTTIQSGVRTPVNEPFTGVPVLVYASTSSCVEVRFDPSPIPIVGTTVDFEWQSVWKSTTNAELFRALCAITKGTKVADNLVIVNAIIG